MSREEKYAIITLPYSEAYHEVTLMENDQTARRDKFKEYQEAVDFLTVLGYTRRGLVPFLMDVLFTEVWDFKGN